MANEIACRISESSARRTIDSAHAKSFHATQELDHWAFPQRDHCFLSNSLRNWNNCKSTRETEDRNPLVRLERLERFSIPFRDNKPYRISDTYPIASHEQPEHRKVGIDKSPTIRASSFRRSCNHIGPRDVRHRAASRKAHNGNKPSGVGSPSPESTCHTTNRSKSVRPASIAACQSSYWFSWTGRCWPRSETMRTTIRVRRRG